MRAPDPSRSARRFKLISPVISQSSSDGWLLETFSMRHSAGEPLSVATAVIRTGTILWFGGQS